MSPLSVRRYRAERLLREEFDRLRGTVIEIVSGRLRSRGVRLDASDLEACYSQAWQGLYAAVLDGQEIANPTGWLVVVTFRRAIEEHRPRARAHGQHDDGESSLSYMNARTAMPTGARAEGDLAAELDDRVRLRQLFEALRGRLSERELQAAVLCYLQGMPRSEAAQRMGVSEGRMRKLMEGHGPGRPGVAGKVGALVETIRGGGWCEEQGSLMRGLAYGILDPAGERYRLALIHRSECPACRAYVLSLRGLAAVLPPVPALLQWALGVGGGAAAGTAAATGTGAGSAALSPGPAIGGALGATGAAGAGAAGGSWLAVGGPVSAKLAVGCLLALGVGAGCVALTEHPGRPAAPSHGHEAARGARSGGSAVGAGTAGGSRTEGEAGFGASRAGTGARTQATLALRTAARATREFGPEQGLATGTTRSAGSAASQPAPTARYASSASEPGAASGSSSVGGVPAGSVPAASASAAKSGSAGELSSRASPAVREFAPG